MPTTSHEGGEVFRADDWMRLDRALITGTGAGTFYATAKDLTIDNLKVVQRCLKKDADRTVRRIIDVSTHNIAPKNDPALMALAMASIDPRPDVRDHARAGLPGVARIGTHLFHFLEYRKALQGKITMSRGMRRAISDWYSDHDARGLAYEVTKYQQRDGMSHKDVLRLVHPKPEFSAHDGIFGYVMDETIPWNDLDDKYDAPDYIQYLQGVFNIKHAESAKEAAELIAFHRLPREVVPTHFLNEPVVWEALLQDMPIGALIRNLPKLTSLGLLAPGSSWDIKVAEKLKNTDILKRGRIHPMQILLASHVYGQGHGEKGRLTWKPSQQITWALSDAFPLAFGSVEPTGKRLCIAVDTSRSMTAPTAVGLSARQIGAAMALITANIEPNVHLVGFSGHLSPLPIKRNMRLDEVVSNVLAMDGNTTYCRLPIEYALQHGDIHDAFVLYTDNETADGVWGRSWKGDKNITFHNTLARYREEVNAGAKLVVAAMAANDIRLSDPNDPLSLDCAGFSADLPAVISGFIHAEGGQNAI